MKLKTILCIAGFLLTLATRMNAQTAPHDSIRVHIMQNENGVMTNIDTVVAFSQHDQLHDWLLTKGIDAPAPPSASGDVDSLQVEVVKVITDNIEGDSSHQMVVRVMNGDKIPDAPKNMKIIMLPDDPKAPLPPLPPLPPAPPAAPGMKMRTPVPPDAPELENDNDIQIIIIKDSTGVQTENYSKVILVTGTPETPTVPSTASNEKKSPDAKDLTIYPNPSNGHITLNIDMPGKGNTEIKVTDMNGKTVYTESLGETEGKVSKEIDLSKNGKGIYNVEVRKNGNVVVERVVIQ